jgi:hypothetical protein
VIFYISILSHIFLLIKYHCSSISYRKLPLSNNVQCLFLYLHHTMIVFVRHLKCFKKALQPLFFKLI